MRDVVPDPSPRHPDSSGLAARRTTRATTHRLALLLAPLLALAVMLAGMSSSSAGERNKGQAAAKPKADQPLVIGHRGASGYRPEHTLASYELAARMGADYIEPDLVSTKDGVLVARHENEISGTTNVADHPEFADRKTTKTVDDVELTGWFTEDFTLAELKTLRAIERIPDIRQENTTLNGRFEIPTFAEILTLRAELSKELKREIGVYPEIKHPYYFTSIGLPLEKPLVETLEAAHLNRKNAPVFVQAFELTPLEKLRTEYGLKTQTVFLVWISGAPQDLIEAGDPRTWADLMTPAELAKMSSYVDGIGPEKTLVIPRRDDGTLGEPTSLVADVHEAGMLIHPYTFRAENTFLPPALRSNEVDSDFGDLITEIQTYLDAGIDGFFTDQPDLGVLARNDWVSRQ